MSQAKVSSLGEASARRKSCGASGGASRVVTCAECARDSASSVSRVPARTCATTDHVAAEIADG